MNDEIKAALENAKESALKECYPQCEGRTYLFICEAIDLLKKEETNSRRNHIKKGF